MIPIICKAKMRLPFRSLYRCSLTNIHQKHFFGTTRLPESKQLIMSMADIAGIKTVPHALINGRKNNIRKKDFLIFANNCGIEKSTAEKIIKNLVSLTPKFLSMCEASLLPDDLKERLARIITERIEMLSI